MFAMVDYAREMTSTKACKYGKYGWCEHLLFLFCLGDIFVHGANCMHEPVDTDRLRGLIHAVLL